MAQSQPPMPNPKIDNLKHELANIDTQAMPEVSRLVEEEIYKLTSESLMKGPPPNPDYIDINDKNRIKISHKIIIPNEFFPGYNFVGKLLGNKGENLKKLCTETNTRMAILGRGSTRDRNKEQELLESGAPEYQHIREPLHVRVESHGPCKQVWTNMAAAIDALAPYMKPDDTYVPPPLPPQWGGGAGWGNDGNPSYGAPAMGRGGMRGGGGGMRGGRGDMRGGNFPPRGRGGGRGGSFRGGRGGMGSDNFGGGMDGNGGFEEMMEEMKMEEGDAFGNGYGQQSHSSFGKAHPRGGGGPAMRGPTRGRGGPRGGGRPY